MRPLALTVLLLAGPAAAQDFGDALQKIQGGKSELQQSRVAAVTGQAICKGDGPSAECKCPNGRNGIRKLRIAVYAPANTEFEADRFTDAVVAYGKVNVLLRKTNQGTVELLLNPARASSGKDPDLTADKCFPQALQRIHDMQDLCHVIKEANTRATPKAGSLPVYYIYPTNAEYFQNKRAAYARCGKPQKEIDALPSRGFVETYMDTGGGAHANGVTFKEGIQAACSANGVDGVTNKTIVLINLEPSQKHAHVLAHEVGHAIGMASGKSQAIFADIRDKSVDNIMSTERTITREQMNITANQARLICESPYLGDEA